MVAFTIENRLFHRYSEKKMKKTLYIALRLIILL